MSPREVYDYIVTSVRDVMSSHPRWCTAVGIGMCTIGFCRMLSKLGAVSYTRFVDMSGKTVIVTGANSGIGFETAKAIANLGAKVILACRDVNKAQKAAEEIIAFSNNRNVVVKKLDLCSFASVRQFAEDINKNERNVHVLINNAGTIGTNQKKVTVDGCEMIMQSNHLGPFLLTILLIEKLKSSAPSRIVTVSSMMYEYHDLDVKNLNSENIKYDYSLIYNNSKFANILFTLELTRRLKETGVTSNCLHPGIVSTNLSKNIRGPMYYLIKFVTFLFGKTPALGAQTSIYAAVDPELENISGKYFIECEETKMPPYCYNDLSAKRLWSASEELINVALRVQ